MWNLLSVHDPANYPAYSFATCTSCVKGVDLLQLNWLRARLTVMKPPVTGTDGVSVAALPIHAYRFSWERLTGVRSEGWTRSEMFKTRRKSLKHYWIKADGHKMFRQALGTRKLCTMETSPALPYTSTPLLYEYRVSLAWLALRFLLKHRSHAED